ncbi:MAG: NAD(+) synthase [bacterium]|nr:NAD(+) synthase [bacterium]
MRSQKENFGFVRVAAVSPRLRVGDPHFNVDEMLQWLKRAEKQGATLVVFPELGISGYTVADLHFQKTLQDATKKELLRFVSASKNIRAASVVGFALPHEGKLFNVAALVYKGTIWGIVPKTYIPGYKEFYEERWFASGRDLLAKEVELFGKKIPVGTDILFRFPRIPGAILGIEICEDVWVPLPPSSFQALVGATLIANPSASNDWVGRAEYRRELIKQQSARGMFGYVYASCGVHESTTDLVFGGHALIGENGTILAESKRFSREGEMIVSDIDVEYLLHERERTTSFGESVHESPQKVFRFVDVLIEPASILKLERLLGPNPFVPANPAERDMRAKEIFSIQVAGLAKRLEAIRAKNLIIGLSGGLDSTLALLVAVKTMETLGISLKNTHAFSMPGFGTSNRTRKNARRLAESLGVSFEEIDITKGVLQQFRDIGHDHNNESVVYENAQARYRTYTLMDKANQMRGIVVGTGDLSEIALGWNTYTGDHIAHYNVNCSIPKTLVKYLVQWVSETEMDKKTQATLDDILATPISPELKKSRPHEITHKTEDIIGPYELHDFFLFHFIRRAASPRKILFVARHAWGEKYSNAVLKKWLRLFLERFFGAQWKRSVATDGPKVGSVSLSPRGDWRMPSDAEARAWLDELR